MERFAQGGGQGLVNIGANEEYNQNALQISQQAQSSFPQLWVKCSLGLHPCDVKNTSQDVNLEYLKLKTQIEQNREHIVAIGECGIDLYYPEGAEYFRLQQELFKMQCELARELELPIVIHSRSAFEETLEILQEFSDLKIYFHCWSYSKEELEKLLATFPKLWI